MTRIIALPRIIIKPWCKAEEIKLFMNFLHHRKFPTHRHLILNAFPGLREELRRTHREKAAVRTFLDTFCRIHRTTITSIVRSDRIAIAKQSPTALRALTMAMNYVWHRLVIYHATPTILPFSPFGTDRFYFSIFDAITGKGTHRVLVTAIHEISHFVFFDMLKRIEHKEKISLPMSTKHFLQEALTAALFNEAPLKSVLKIKKYEGNPEIRGLYIRWGDHTPISLVNVIRTRYRTTRREKISFDQFLTELVMLGYRHRTIFARKSVLWNRYGKQILSEPRLAKQYSTPITIK